MFKIELLGLFCIEAPTLKDVEALLVKVDSLVEKYDIKVAPAASAPAMRQAPIVESEPNVDRWVALHGALRFRLTKEENAQGFNREEAAKARLINEGQEIIGPPSAASANQLVVLNEEDEEFV